MKTDHSLPYDAVVAGYLGVDLTPGFPSMLAAIPLTELLRPGKLIETEGLGLALGGVVANTGLAMKKFGARVALMGLVGNDLLGNLVLTKLKAQGISSGIRRTDRAGTAYGIVLAPPGIDRMFLEDPGCNGVMTSDDIDYQTVVQSRLFHFGYPTLMKSLYRDDGAELRKLFGRVRALGVATSLDMTLPHPDSPAGKTDWLSILAAVLPLVDIFAPSLEELLFLMEPKQYAAILSGVNGGDIVDKVPQDLCERLGKKILDLGVSILMIKAGHRGAYIRTGDITRLNAATALRLAGDTWNNRAIRVPAFPADPARIKNACGAGDCAVAGFLTAILNGANLQAAGYYAMLAGRDNLYGVDSLSGLSAWPHMTEIMKEIMTL